MRLPIGRGGSGSGGGAPRGSDAHYLGSDEWTRVKGNYRVRIRGVWFYIEDSQTLRPDGEPNPTGQAILWYQLTEFGFSIRCFTPQYES
jgi:hypothetical protein